MTVFVDASAIVAILTGEKEAADLSLRLRSTKSATTSPIAVFEAAQAIARKTDGDLHAAQADVNEFLTRTGMTSISIDAVDGMEALAAHRRFGKGRHPAALNMGDCFAYACAKRLGVPLLYKGNDFALTDIQSALKG
jgi:ribonuclease VapC